MSKEKGKTSRKGKPKTTELSPLAVLYEASDISFRNYIDHSEVEKLSEKLGKKVTVVSMAFTIPDNNKSIILMNNPATENKTVMITSDKKTADSFYKALKAIK